MRISQVAIRAASLWHTCGRDAALRYADNRGCPRALVRLAVQMQAGNG